MKDDKAARETVKCCNCSKISIPVHYFLCLANLNVWFSVMYSTLLLHILLICHHQDNLAG